MGENVGEIIIFKDGVELERIALLAGTDIEKASWFDCLQDIAREWTGK